MGITKKDFLDMLERNKSYQRALSAVDSDQQKRIRNILDTFMGQAVDKMSPVIDRLNNDPQLIEQVRERMRRGPDPAGEVVIDEEIVVSGSKAD